MLNFPNIINLKKDYKPKNMLKNVSYDNPHHYDLNPFFFEKNRYKNNINLLILDSHLRTKNDIEFEDLINVSSTKNTNKNTPNSSNIINNYYNYLPKKTKCTIQLSKHPIQQKKVRNKFIKNMKVINSKFSDYTRPLGIVKKTNPKFYLPKLINLSTNFGRRNINLSIDKELHEKENECNFEENTIDEKLNYDKVPIFLEKKIKYNNMKNIRLNIKSPGERNKLRKYVVNLNKILAINKYDNE